MEWTTPPVVPAPAQAEVAEPGLTSPSIGTGVRRAILTAAISGLLLVGGAVAVVSAASPEPSTAPSTTAPSDGSGTQQPRQRGTGSPADCPDKAAGDGSDSGSGTTPSAPTTPSTPTLPSTVPTPAT